jgi:chemotaxis protein methyltransferase CheR
MMAVDHTMVTPQSITGREFGLFQELIDRETGIYLSPAKKALLVGRLSRRLRELGLTSFGEYYRRVVEGDGQERVRMIDCICTNETHFFREPGQFEFLQQHIYPQWIREAEARARPRQIKVWSAACSTGEEPYSIAMSLLSHFSPDRGWQIDILATDLSTRALEKARNATWPLEKSKEIPTTYLKPFMLRGTRSMAGLMRAGPEIRSLIRFQHLNLNADYQNVGGNFDLIFCRNVMIYFNEETRRRTVAKLLNHLSPRGHLLLGHAESLNGVTDRVRCVTPTIYSPSAVKKLVV